MVVVAAREHVQMAQQRRQQQALMAVVQVVLRPLQRQTNQALTEPMELVVAEAAVPQQVPVSNFLAVRVDPE
jgi:hypothetical protein